MKNQKIIHYKIFLFIILFSTSFISLQTLKKVNIQDIRISGNKLFTKNDVVANLSLKFPIHMILINTNLIEKELKQNLSLKNVSVSRQIFPFGLNIYAQTRTPIAYGEKILNEEKISGFIDKNGIFINKQNVDEKNLNKLKIQVFGWKKNLKNLYLKFLLRKKIMKLS